MKSLDFNYFYSLHFYLVNVFFFHEQKLRPSEKLDRFLESKNLDEGLDCDTILSICQEYDLDKIDVLKYRDLP